jgi:energy-coupling factor transporter transmembrane protein EcfT
MDHLFFFSILGGVAVVFLFVIARIALRWAVRFAVVCLLLLMVLGGAAWWWFKPVPQPEPKPRPAATRRASSDQR